MENLSHELARSPELADRLGLVHAWYIDARNVSTTLRQQLLDFKLDFLRLSLVG